MAQQISCRSDKQFWIYELKQQLLVLRAGRAAKKTFYFLTFSGWNFFIDS
jgi:hypothetical protein